MLRPTCNDYVVETHWTWENWNMPDELEKLLTLSRHREPTCVEQEAQRRSFAFGNTHFENERITRETVDRAAEELTRNDDQKNGRSAR